MFDFFKSKRREPKAASLENPSTPLSAPDVWLTDVLGDGVSDAGVHVNREAALRCSAVWACVRLLSETVGGLRLVIYKRSGQRDRHAAYDHPLSTLLNDAPNAMMTAFVWREVIMQHKLFDGNSYTVIERNGYGLPVGLYPLLPGQVQVVRKNGHLLYIVSLEGNKKEVFSSEDMLHIPASGWDGITGYAPISVMRNSVGLAMATEKHGARLFANGTNLAATLESEQKIPVERQREILRHFNENFRGLANANKTAILPDGLTLKSVGMSSEDAQFLETRKFQVNDIARIFNVPPHMIGDLEKSSFNNIEQQNINFLMYSVRPWLERIENELNRKLFLDGEYFVEFDTDQLLRGDFKTRSEGYSRYVNGGIMTINEARAKEGLNPVDGGDALRVPVNTVDLEKDQKGVEENV